MTYNFFKGCTSSTYEAPISEVALVGVLETIIKIGYFSFFTIHV